MNLPKAVTVFAGRRDGYQIPWALEDAGALELFVTDEYLPGAGANFSSGWLRDRANLRFCPEISTDSVKVDASAFLLTQLLRTNLMDRPRLLSWRDRALSLKATKLTAERQAVFFPYSYYAGDGIERYRRHLKKILIYQVHPLGGFLRKLYRSMAENCGEYAQSLYSEDEFVNSSDFQEKTDQAPLSADGIVCASSFTRKSLRESGVKCPIKVVPYGVDSNFFTPKRSYNDSPKLTVSFVGTVSERKGFSWLLKSLSCFKGHVELQIITRRPPDKIYNSLLNCVSHKLHLGLDDKTAWDCVRESDLLVLPSLAEGFGLVILEAMACGVPVLTTTNTGGMDLISNGKDGWVVPPASVDDLTRVFESCLTHRDIVEDLGCAARRKAEYFSWANCRKSLTDAYANLVS